MRKNKPTSEWRAGWPVLLISMIAYGNGMGMFLLSSSSFIKPVKDAFGWSTGQAVIAPITSITMAILFPFVGRLIDRWGARPFAIGGLIGLVACYLALGLCPANIVIYRGLALLAGLCLVACGPITFARGVGSWFVANRGTALGILISGLSLGGVLGIPLVGFLIQNYGWRKAYFGLAASIVFIALPLVITFFRERGEAPNSTTKPVHGNSLNETLKDSRFWLLLASFIFAALPIGVFSNHLVPILTGRGFPLPQAVSLGAIFAGSIGIARIGIGILVDRLRDYIVAGSCIIAAGLGAFALFHPIGRFVLEQAQAMIFLLGLAYGAEGDLAAYFTLKLFGLKAFSAIMGCLAAAIGLGTAVGGVLGSLVADRAGSYDPLAPFMAASLLLSGFLMLAQPSFHKARSHRSVAG
ncbi:MFS transporter [Caballeronia sordidicola]|uniref:MFS transporter n=1 Tax=Caballeronia sordidicola TaxID=196367 RepID=UPI0015C52022|nr:MFS transporter [Caballeronia sordidicola]